MQRHNLRDHIGPREDIAVVGPRFCGKSTLAMLLAEFHAMKGRRVFLVDPYCRRPCTAKVAHPSIKATYEIGTKAPDGRGQAPYDVVIHDGYIPPATHCRVIMASEIF